MRTQSVCLALMALLLCPVVPAQWVHTNYDGYVGALAVSGTNLFAGDWWTGVFRSTDNGISWTAVNAGMTDTNVTALAVSGSNLFAGTHDGVFLSTDNGTSWTQTGLTNVMVQFLCEWDGSLLVATVDDGVFVSADSGKSWGAVGTPNYYVWSLAVSGTDIFAGTLGGGVFLTTDCGTSWTAVNSGLADTNITSLAFIGTDLFAGTSGGRVFLTTNNGATWTCTVEQAWSVSCFAVSGSNLFAGTSNFFGGGNGVLLITNNGAIWTTVNSGLTNSDVRSLVVSGSNLFAGTSGGGVWRRPLSEMITSVDPGVNALPHKFTLHQNYPNPFNPSTTIKYELPKSSDVRLSVYDMLGREVSVLVNERKDAGSYEVKFNAAGLSSGVYFYGLQAGSFIQTRRMILVK